MKQVRKPVGGSGPISIGPPWWQLPVNGKGKLTVPAVSSTLHPQLCNEGPASGKTLVAVRQHVASGTSATGKKIKKAENVSSIPLVYCTIVMFDMGSWQAGVEVRVK